MKLTIEELKAEIQRVVSTRAAKQARLDALQHLVLEAESLAAELENRSTLLQMKTRLGKMLRDKELGEDSSHPNDLTLEGMRKAYPLE